MKALCNSDISAVLVASGPFFTSDSLSNDPLTELVSNVKELKPNLTLLMAPFLDERHPSVRKEPSNIIAYLNASHSRSPTVNHFDDMLTP